MEAIDAALRTAHVGHAMHVGLVHCRPATPLRTVARIMAAHRIHAVVVEDEVGGTAGVVSDLDLVQALADGNHNHLTAADAAATPLVTVAAAATLEHAAALMAEARATHALVLDHGGLPAGILSMLDIAEVLASTDA